MTIPQSCTVLVIGGGPAGSYASAVLAREGIDTVLLEADKFPRYHIGESTIPSLRHFFQFIDFYNTFNAHGFYQKNGAVFRLAQTQPDAYTDFLEENGPNGYAWNLIRSESDDLLFRHAGTCGAHIFDETKVQDIKFDESYKETKPELSENSNGVLNSARPVSANWARRDGTTGSITFDYLVDASGRRGILSTKYLKNRKFNDTLKNAANWGYWRTDAVYGAGTRKGSPYFEALDDTSGWAWFIPLHDGTRSVGIVQNQQIATEKKKSLGRPSTLEFYKKCLQMAPNINKLLSEAELVTEIKSASDWSYTASTYHLPYARICGDAGSFIDPLFSSGVHLAVTGGLSAAATIAASIKGDCDEQTAGSWHSKKTVESYTRFFLAVSSATRQIRQQHEPILQDLNEEGFQRAFDLFRPIIQGTVDTDTTGKLTQTGISKVLEFCFKAFTYVPPEKKDQVLKKLKSLSSASGKDDVAANEMLSDLPKHLATDELEILETLQSRRMIRDDLGELDSFALDAIDGLAPNLVRGELGLVKSEATKIDKAHFSSPEFLDGKSPGIRDGSIHLPMSRIQLV
ncbi:hypothetical protein ABW20_dc0108032 [Dactylellina cionopaga]|nr:hypothetical protein ABW20_dc0108032 [Dactylellina cionopaga]